MKEVEFGKTSTHIHGEGKRGNSKTTLEGNAKTWNEPIPTLLKQHKQRLVPFKSTQNLVISNSHHYFTSLIFPSAVWVRLSQQLGILGKSWALDHDLDTGV